MSNKETELKEAIESYYKLLSEIEKLKVTIAQELLESEAPEFVLNVLNNEGLGTNEIFSILKQFVIPCNIHN